MDKAKRIRSNSYLMVRTLDSHFLHTSLSPVTGTTFRAREEMPSGGGKVNLA